MKLYVTDLYRVEMRYPLDDVQIDTLYYLYQPLIGMYAMHLYMMLVMEGKRMRRFIAPCPLSRLTSYMSMSVMDMEKALRSLEAIGLVKTYVKHENDITQYIYRLYAPLSLKAFFKNQILSSLLQLSLSEDDFQKTVQYFKISLENLDGYEDIMVAGGSEASITPLSVAGFASMKALHTGEDKNRASIPFDKDRSGFVMGEGAAVLVLEELQHALDRNATIYGEIVGYGATCDAYHITAPLSDGSGGGEAMKQALEDAALQPSDIDYINAHGTSTPLNDKTETMAVKYAFGDDAYHLAMSSTKSYTGHLLGASGALESVICVKALQEGYIPATIHYQNKDEDCDLDIVANVGRKQDIHYAMNNSLGFGGHNASLIFKKWED